MSYADIMIYAVQLDTWKQRFSAITEYNKLEATNGYKFCVNNRVCYLDPPSLWQHISRWYYGHSKERFKEFLDEQSLPFFRFLKDVKESDVLGGRTQPARAFTSSLIFFLSDLARAFSVCRTAYPDYDALNSTLLAYYHGIREWIAAIGY